MCEKKHLTVINFLMGRAQNVPDADSSQVEKHSPFCQILPTPLSVAIQLVSTSSLYKCSHTHSLYIPNMHQQDRHS